MKIYLSTLGCKLNESELESWSRRFAGDGYQIVNDPREADLCVLNTCTVTHIAARKSRQIARQLARGNPHARLVLTGCYTSLAPAEARSLPNVALVVPNADKDRLVAQVSDFRFQTHASRLAADTCGVSVLDSAQSPTSNPSTRLRASLHAPMSRTRAFVKIQDGCNMSCTYCIIPLARGRECSRPREEIVSDVKGLVNAGYKESILTGVQISAYKNGGDKVHGLRDLVAAILAETDVPRLRLTSIAPWKLDGSLLDLWRDARLCRHLHLSLQSGCDTVLRRMRRPYTTREFARAVELAHEKIPDVAITTDVIVGFPDESDTDFEQSLRFVESMAFSRVHVFPYSARAGTVAASLQPRVPGTVKESRAKQMQAVADASARTFAQKFVGRTMDVLWEACEASRGAEGQRSRAEIAPLHPRPSAPLQHWNGYTDNYLRVVAASDAVLHNRIVPARLLDLVYDGTVAIIGNVSMV
jgi:threonylcarbamoyladenosine tRNA methylthiotransferase MtaB